MSHVTTFTQLLLDYIVKENGKGSRIFGVCGAATYMIDEILMDYDSRGLVDYVHAANESSGVFMAAYGSAVGVAITTAGPGTCMAIPGIASAYNEWKPVVIICGVPTNDFQYVDPSIMLPITKAMIYIDASTTNPSQVLETAFDMAQKGTESDPGPGPVVIFVLSSEFTKQVPANAVVPYTPAPSTDMEGFTRLVATTCLNKNRIILRVSHRLSPDNLRDLIQLTEDYPQFYIHLTASAYGMSSGGKNVGREGPLGNFVVNNNYLEADVVLTLDSGIVYQTIAFYDIRPYCPSTTQFFYLYDTVNQYTPPFFAPGNHLMSSPNDFVPGFIALVREHMEPAVSTGWPDIRASVRHSFDTMFRAYLGQKKNNVLTTASVVTQVLDAFYSHKDVLSRDYYYVMDVGAVSFISALLINTQLPGRLVVFDEFSQIGCSAAAAAGIVHAQGKDVVVVIGDGGFLNGPGYWIDLANAVYTKKVRCLVLLLNDRCYSNVALGEEKLFGTTTDISSTSYLQKHVSLFSVLESLVGGFKEKLLLSNLTRPSRDLCAFSKRWYKNKYTEPGFYGVYYSTTVIPSFYTEPMPSPTDP